MENEIQSYEQQISDINFANEAKLNDLDPEQRNDYEKYKADNQQLQSDIQASRAELDEINGKLTHAESVLRQDTLKQRST